MFDNSYKDTFGWKSPLNIWTWGYRWNWRYPSTWWDCVKQFFRNIKYAYQRTVQGYCDKDVWDLDEYYSLLFYSSLSNLADISMSYPGDQRFPTYESWSTYLYEMAKHFKYASEYYQEECYPTYAKAFEKWDGTHENFKLLNNEMKQMSAEQEYHYRIAFHDMCEVYKNLWD